MHFFSIFTSVPYKIYLKDLKGMLLGGSLEARWTSNWGHELSFKKPLHDVPFWASHLMYIIMVNFLEGIYDLSWPLKMKNIMFWYFFSLNFSNFTSDMDYTLLQDLKKVHCLWESFEARWSSTGGHNISSNVPLNDVPF